MNTSLSAQVDQTHHHPPSSPVRAATVRRVSLPDRVALHVGLALITWSRRPHTVDVRPNTVDLYARNEQARERAEREREWQRATFLTQPRR
ncbi:MAG TPA: hypothetical protein VHZ81_11210 [Galbitalea sp.]|jgi:hypothetical protein|nr:hypothetical protein [Galbitalea sp.]